MTSHRKCRCRHCRVLYYCQMSGPGFSDFNDSQYCEDCQRVVFAALAGVPRKFEQDWTPTDEVTFKQLKAWEAEAEKEDEQARREGKIVGRRVGVPLFKISEGPDGRSVVGDAQVVHYVKGRGSFVDRFYEYRHWPDNLDEVEIRLQVERDLSDGSTRPWKVVRWW